MRQNSSNSDSAATLAKTKIEYIDTKEFKNENKNETVLFFKIFIICLFLLLFVF
jgi:hypothetical protein